MLGYGMAKAAVHQLTLGLGQKESGLPAGSTAVAILPLVTAKFMRWIICVFHHCAVKIKINNSLKLLD